MDSDGEGSSGSRSPVTGVVTEALPHALYRVRIEAGSGGVVTAHIADRMGRNFVRILIGDRVKVEISAVDVGRGRIVERL